ncbi:MAG: NPCBM/NEW2 domain-containing protein [Armatimonadota bacterium]
MISGRVICLALTAVCAVSASAQTVKPTADELASAHKWVSAHFSKPKDTVIPVKAAAKKAEPGLLVLANNDPVIKNNRQGAPLKILDKEYTRGLYCHAVSKVIVRLPGHGKNFSSIIGLDAHAGGGSVVFSVNVGGKEAFSSGLMTQGMEGIPVSVDLNGADEFVLLVGDGGDGIACDQSNWAEAKVTMQDGSEVWLADLPFIDDVEPLTPRSDFRTPFSFIYGGKHSDEFLASWDFKETKTKLDANRTQRILTYTDSDTGLVVTLKGIEYLDFPTVEWTVYFKNNGKQDTPILEQIQAIDTRISRSGEGEFVLHHNKGTMVTAEDFAPLTTELTPGLNTRLTSAQGRPCAAVWPYFNIEGPESGMIVVVGWPGKWSAQFNRDSKENLRIAAGQEFTHLTLHPGEEIRTPLIVLQFYKGNDIDRVQNIWRRWMIAYNVPRPGGKLPAPQLTPCSSHQYAEMTKADEASQIMFVDRYVEERIKIDYWWMDAGWYPCDGSWPKTGTWEVDRTRFPRGLRAVSDHAREKGIKTIVWFEPERVGGAGTWLYDNHKDDWLLGGTLLNLGNPDAWDWLVNHIDKIINDEGIDLYRQDFNMDPLPYWRSNDSDDRQGITENHYVTGYLAYWDELRRRHPNMLIDSCASGGHRNDLETMRRSVPLLRSDYIFEPVGQQGHTYGLAKWLPYFGTGEREIDSYIFRSCMGSGIIGCWDMRNPDLDYDLLRKLTTEWRSVASSYMGDYYPLTPYSLDRNDWMAWQFDSPESGEGMVQAFRRDESGAMKSIFKLRGLDKNASYAVTDIDTGRTETLSGDHLMETGLRVMISDKPGSALISYKKIEKGGVDL